MGDNAAADLSKPMCALRSWGNWLNLTTPLGLAVAALGRADVRRHPRGLFLAEHYRLPFPAAGAFTVGNVLITGSDWDELLNRYPRLLEHEEAHTWQYLYCLGLPYYLVYTGCLAWSVLRTGDRASRNFFERRAGLQHGGYEEQNPRPLAQLLAVLRPRRSAP
jgi:hypothetical protein